MCFFFFYYYFVFWSGFHFNLFCFSETGVACNVESSTGAGVAVSGQCKTCATTHYQLTNSSCMPCDDDDYFTDVDKKCKRKLDVGVACARPNACKNGMSCLGGFCCNAEATSTKGCAACRKKESSTKPYSYSRSFGSCGCTRTITFTIPNYKPNSPVYVTTTQSGDLDHSYEYLNMYVNGRYAARCFSGSTYSRTGCNRVDVRNYAAAGNPGYFSIYVSKTSSVGYYTVRFTVSGTSSSAHLDGQCDSCLATYYRPSGLQCVGCGDDKTYMFNGTCQYRVAVGAQCPLTKACLGSSTCKGGVCCRPESGKDANCDVCIGDSSMV